MAETQLTWREAQRGVTLALKDMQEALGEGRPAMAKQYMFVARAGVGDALRLDSRPLPEWVRVRREEGAS